VTLAERHGVPIGLSDHTLGSAVATAAAVVYLLTTTSSEELIANHDVDPDRVSFIRTLRLARRSVTEQAAFSP